MFHADILVNEQVSERAEADGTPVTVYTYDRAQFSFTPGIISVQAVRSAPELFVSLEGDTDKLYGSIMDAVQKYIDSFAKDEAANRNYDSVQSAISYLNDPNPVFAAEAEAFRNFRSAVWTQVRELQRRAKEGDATAIPALLALPAGLPEPDFSNVPEQ